MIDRLEKRGYARRERDPHDRRKVIVRPDPEKANAELGPLFQHFLEMYLPLLEKYNDDELRLILRYFEDSHDLLQEQILWLKNRKE